MFDLFGGLDGVDVLMQGLQLQALINLLVKKGVFTQEELAHADKKVMDTPEGQEVKKLIQEMEKIAKIAKILKS